jgi:hypothetical protein
VLEDNSEPRKEPILPKEPKPYMFKALAKPGIEIKGKGQNAGIAIPNRCCDSLKIRNLRRIRSSGNV